MSTASQARALEAAFRANSARRTVGGGRVPKPPTSGYGSGSIPRLNFNPKPAPSVLPRAIPVPKAGIGLGIGRLAGIIGGAATGIGLGITVLSIVSTAIDLYRFFKDLGEQNQVRQETPDSRGIPPFRGGQSVGVQYRIFFGINRSNGITESMGSIQRAGRIGNVYSTPVGNTTSRNWYYRAGIGSPSVPLGTEYNLSLNLGAGNTWFIEKVERVDGQPDTGGDPQAENATPYGKAPAPVISPPPYAPEINPAPAPSTAPRPAPRPSPNREPRRVPSPIGNPPPNGNPSPNSSPNGNPSGNPSPNNSPAPSTGASPTPAPTFAPNPLPPANPDIQSPDSKPRPSERPQVKPKPPNSPEPTPPDLRPELQQLKESQEKQEELLKNIPFLIPSLLANNDLFQQSIKNRAKEGTCEAVQPNECLGSKLNADKEEIKSKLDANEAAQDAGIAGILAFLQTMFDWIKRAFNNTIVDKAVSYLTLITTIHNAAMLSTSIKDTLGEALSLGLATVGIKDPEGSPIDINEAINKSTEDLIKGVIGADNYTALKETWAKASRIWQSGAAIIYNVRSLWDSARSLDELTNNYVAKIGNSLRRDGVVSENAYKNMSENASPVNVAMEKLNNLDDAASTLAAITSETYGITENLVELTKQREDFEKNVKDFAPKTQIENEPLKEKEDAEKAVSVSPAIPLTELYKPDI